MVTARRHRGRLPHKAFQSQFGFPPVEGQSLIKDAQRALERTIVAQELRSLWRAVERCEMELRQRDPPAWMVRQSPRTIPNRKQLSQHLPVLKRRYERAERLARAFNLHPDQYE